MGDPKPEFDYNLWRQLDPEYLKDQWAWRQSVFGWQTASGVLSATAWFLLLPPLVAFAWVQSRGGKYRIAVHGGIAFAAIAGALFESVSTLMSLGSNATMSWIQEDFVLAWGNQIFHPNHNYTNGYVPHGYFMPNIIDDKYSQRMGDDYVAVPAGIGYKSLELTVGELYFVMYMYISHGSFFIYIYLHGWIIHHRISFLSNLHIIRNELFFCALSPST